MRFTIEQKAMAKALYEMAPNGTISHVMALSWLLKTVCYILLWIIESED